MKIERARVVVTCPGRNFVTLVIETGDGVRGIGDGDGLDAGRPCPNAGIANTRPTRAATRVRPRRVDWVRWSCWICCIVAMGRLLGGNGSRSDVR